MIEDEFTITEEKVRLGIVAELARAIVPGVLSGTEEGQGRAESILAGLSGLCMTADRAANETLEVFRRSSKHWRPIPVSLKKAIQDSERMKIAAAMVNALAALADPVNERVAWLAGNRERQPDPPPGWAMSAARKINEARKIADNVLREEVRAYELSK